MGRFLVRRIALGVVVMWLITVAVFALFFVAPNDVARTLAGRQAQVPVDLIGTAFQKKVWDALMKIPHGQTRSYTQIAEAIGHPRSMRAVANACANNHVAIVVPCHRVVRGDGSLGGYRWGLPMKQRVLERERVA